MRLFIGYGYNERDKWIEELVFPLVNALGCEVVNGRASYGDNLAVHVKETILSCEALMGFATRRDRMGERWTTHRWVIEELSCAFSRIPTVEVNETGVDPQLGMLGGHQRIHYSEDARDRCLVDIAEAVSLIRTNVSHTTFRLEPSEFTAQFRNLLTKPGLRCSYRLMRRGMEGDLKPAKIWPAVGSLCMAVEGLRISDLIQVCVTYGEECWTSDYEAIDCLKLKLIREQ